jgi:hypothetical protein
VFSIVSQVRLVSRCPDFEFPIDYQTIKPGKALESAGSKMTIAIYSRAFQRYCVIERTPYKFKSLFEATIGKIYIARKAALSKLNVLMEGVIPALQSICEIAKLDVLPQLNSLEGIGPGKRISIHTGCV